MKKAFIWCVSLAITSVCPAQSIRIHTFEEVNRTPHTTDSHAGQEGWSSLEPIFSSYSVIPSDVLMPEGLPVEQRQPCYPRIKYLPNGQFIMTYQGGESSSRIISSRSNDFKNWFGRAKLVDVKTVEVDGAKDYRRSTNMDIAVLRNGMLLGVYVFRAQNAMRKTGNGCGLFSVRSLDNGKTWTAPSLIYEGVCAEPDIVELPNGTVQVYFSDKNVKTNSTCISLIESTDYGLTFSPKTRISRQFKYYDGGVKVFTDKGPSFCRLNNGKMFGIVEDQIENEPGAESFDRLSLLYNDDAQWSPVGAGNLWPASRKTNVVDARAPRILALPSGETITAMTCDGVFQMNVLDHSAQQVNNRNWSQDSIHPFKEKGHWSDMEMFPDGHKIAVAMDTKTDGIVTEVFFLNHNITAPEMPIILDGDNDDWYNDEAFFIGSDSPAHAIFRASTHEDNLYLMAECVDSGLNPIVKLTICNERAKIKKGGYAELSFNSKGLISSSTQDIAIEVREGNTANGESGFVGEICIPMPKIGLKKGSIALFNAEIITKSGVKTQSDGFSRATKDPATWQRIELSGKEIPAPFRASHSGEEQFSTLQPMPRYSCELPASYLLKGLPETSTDQNFTCYPRIKKMANGEYIMFYMGGRFGSRIWCTTSKDFIEWSEPQMLFSPYYLDMPDGTRDVRRYMDADATVLQNGDVLMVSSFRATKHYPQMIGSGLALRRSTDNGRTWSEPWEICHESNWEPTIIALPDGRVQCYFTHSNPQTLNSGTSVMTSYDNGETWTPPMRCSRQYKYHYGDTDIYTDQMPSVCLLPDGKTLAGWFEARLESKVPIDYADKKYYSSYYKMSLVLNDGFDWKDLGEHSEGPARRHNNVERGAGGYIDAFPSGEVVVGCGKDGYYCVKILSSDADTPIGSNWSTGWIKALPGHGFWGTILVDTPQTMVAAIHNESTKGMQIARFFLNHRIDARPGEFSQDALYLGTANGAETYIRASRDENDLILKVDGSGPVDNLEIRLCSPGSDNQIVRTISTADGEERVNLEQLGNVQSGDYICIFATLASGSQKAVFSQSAVAKTSSWQRIRIK